MSFNLVEKGFAIFCIGASVLFMAKSYFSGPKVEKHNAYKVRQQLLKRQDTKMLYSTMSFFYLLGFKQQSIESFFTLHKILEIEKPNLIALPISKEDYQNKYLKAMAHPKFRQAMDKFIFYLKNQDKEAISKMEQFDLKNLEKLFLIDHCIRLKKCKIICGRRPAEQYKSLEKIYTDLKQKEKEKEKTDNLSINDMKIEDYSENIVQEMNPKMTFSILPQSPYKTVVGVIEPELLAGAAQRWKLKFQKNYSHQVIEDEEVVEREKIMREAQNKEV